VNRIVDRIVDQIMDRTMDRIEARIVYSPQDSFYRGGRNGGPNSELKWI
jgi:heme O synthase-like polyprenyltransferase